MDIVIATASETPIYRQIYEQICAEIVRGELAPGDALPPIRVIAKELRISVITVKKAWEELEHAGFIYTQAGRGCFVAERPTAGARDLREALVTERLQKELDYCRSLGLTKREVLALVERCYRE